MIWKPNVTVAAIVEQNGKFLLVEERASPEAQILYNQPAGHLEADESLIQAAVRETFEETGYHFQPQWLLGVYHWYCADNDTTYLRFAFCGAVTDFDPNHVLESCIVKVGWYDWTLIEDLTMRHRSPLVKQCIQDFIAGKYYPLELLTHYHH